MENSVYYDQLAKKAIEKNIGYLLRKLSREGEQLFTPPIRNFGIYYIKKPTSNPWRVQMDHKYIGVFATEELAMEARDRYLKACSG